MNKLKIIASFVLGAGIVLGAQGIMVKAENKNVAYMNGIDKLSYAEQYDDNESFEGTEEDFFREMYNYCHGNGYRNQVNRKGMMNNYNYSMMQDF